MADIYTFPQQKLYAELGIDKRLVRLLEEAAQDEGKSIDDIISEGLELRVIYYAALKEKKQFVIYDHETNGMYEVEFKSKRSGNRDI